MLQEHVGQADLVVPQLWPDGRKDLAQKPAMHMRVKSSRSQVRGGGSEAGSAAWFPKGMCARNKSAWWQHRCGARPLQRAQATNSMLAALETLPPLTLSVTRWQPRLSGGSCSSFCVNMACLREHSPCSELQAKETKETSETNATKQSENCIDGKRSSGSALAHDAMPGRPHAPSFVSVQADGP